jgi:uncharacterized protein (TIGR02231 family)
MIALIVVAALATPAQTEKIDRVVVFADRAEVTRTVSASCEGGDGGAAKAVFAELPDTIDVRTLRGGTTTKDAAAVGVSTQRVQLKESLDERVRALQKDINTLQEQRDALVRAGEDAAERARSVNSYGAYLRALASEEMRQAKPDAARWDQTLDFLDAEANILVAQAVTRAAELRVIDRKMERFNARLARLSPAAAPSSLQAAVAVKCAGAPRVDVTLAYIVPGATWQPEYDLRWASPGKVGEGKATLTVAGVISQSTGEDWSDAQLWLSTSKPLLGGEAPLPNPIYVVGNADESKKTLVQAQEHRAEDLEAGKSSGEAANARSAELEDGGKAFVLKLPHRVTVRADGRPYWFPVDDVATKGKAALVALPALSPYVFQLASFKNPAPYPLMAGRVHVYRGATFVGDVDIEYRAPGEPMEVSLGLDEEIELDRKDLLQQNREPQFLSGNQSIVNSFRTILKNRSDSEVIVEIREQIPVSKMNDIKVTIDAEKTTPTYTLDAVRGHLKWQTVLKKGATAQRDIAFTIELPKDWALQ